MIKNAELVFENKIISVEVIDNKISDITIFDEDNEIVFSGNVSESSYVQRALVFALAWNFKTNESDLTTGLEPDRQETK